MARHGTWHRTPPPALLFAAVERADLALCVRRLLTQDLELAVLAPARDRDRARVPTPTIPTPAPTTTTTPIPPAASASASASAPTTATAPLPARRPGQGPPAARDAVADKRRSGTRTASGWSASGARWRGRGARRRRGRCCMVRFFVFCAVILYAFLYLSLSPYH